MCGFKVRDKKSVEELRKSLGIEAVLDVVRHKKLR